MFDLLVKFGSTFSDGAFSNEMITEWKKMFSVELGNFKFLKVIQSCDKIILLKRNKWNCHHNNSGLLRGWAE